MNARRPLEGLTVVVTASRRANELASLITNMGGSPYLVPTLSIALLPDEEGVKSFLTAIARGGVDYVVFMTGPGVQATMLAAEKAGVKEEVIGRLNSVNTMVVVRSHKPKAVLAKFGVKVDDLPPTNEATVEGIIELLRQRDLHYRRVAIMWHGSYSSALKDAVTAAGAAEVLESSVYSYSREAESGGTDVLKSMGFSSELPSDEKVVRLIREVVEKERRVDAITFTSPPAARNLFERADENDLKERLVAAMKEMIIVAVGPSTRAAIEENGVQVNVMPSVSGMGAMVTALAEFVSRGKS